MIYLLDFQMFFLVLLKVTFIHQQTHIPDGNLLWNSLAELQAGLWRHVSGPPAAGEPAHGVKSSAVSIWQQ